MVHLAATLFKVCNMLIFLVKVDVLFNSRKNSEKFVSGIIVMKITLLWTFGVDYLHLFITLIKPQFILYIHTFFDYQVIFGKTETVFSSFSSSVLSCEKYQFIIETRVNVEFKVKFEVWDNLVIRICFDVKLITTKCQCKVVHENVKAELSNYI